MQTPPFLILGSAAAEGVPAYFCNCRVCREAAARGVVVGYDGLEL